MTIYKQHINNIRSSSSGFTTFISVSSASSCPNCVYLSIFMYYAERSVKILTAKLFMVLTTCSFVTILLTTHYVIYGELRVKVLAWICVSFSVGVFAAPLSIMAKAIRTKSVEFVIFFVILSHNKCHSVVFLWPLSQGYTHCDSKHYRVHIGFNSNDPIWK